MAVSDHLKPGITDRTRVRIMTVDPANRRVEGMLKDGSSIQIAIWDVPNAFRWPIETEIWIVHRNAGIWMLDRRVQEGAVVGSGPSLQVEREGAPIENMSPGELKLDSKRIINANGDRVLATTASSPQSVAAGRRALGITTGSIMITWGGGIVANVTDVPHLLPGTPSSVQVTMEASGQTLVLAAHAGNFTATTFDIQAAPIGGSVTPSTGFPAMWVAYL